MTPTPLRVAIIGAGPSAFYAAEQLLHHEGLDVRVDMFDRLPTPYGLVRNGVAPDHQKIKSVAKAFAQTAADPRFRFFGYVEYGTDLMIEDLRKFYHQVLFATGAQSDKHMGIPGEDLLGSHPATAFVAWYNGHPDFRDSDFDLSQERVVIVGVGNVAIDVARILCLSPEELRATDMADYAIAALSKSKVREVYLLGRRGPAQAAFTNPEIKELSELADCDVIVQPAEMALDDISKEAVAEANDRALDRKVELLQSFAGREPVGRMRRLFLRFLVSPVALEDDGTGHVGGMRLVRNRLLRSETGTISAEATGVFEEIRTGLVFRSVGYRGAQLSGVPFQDRWGVILNAHGRVLDPETNAPIPGEYVTGWIKRGPSGVIGTNKPDSAETVQLMVEDAEAGRTFQPDPAAGDPEHGLIRLRQPRCVSFGDWCKLDAMELERGRECSRPRVKFTSVDEMLKALDK
ncbi:MAG: FAD-dependent oxidoreductase [Tepidiformaceae bacterium]